MKYLTFLFVFFSFAALAEPSISNDSGQSTETQESTDLQKKKSLSSDKSRGRKESHSDSDERANETSKSKSHSERDSNSHDIQKSGAVEINVNGLLLQEFVRHYESAEPADSMPKPQFVFATCKPMTGIVSEYPTLNSCPSAGQIGGRQDLNFIVPRRLATHFTDCGGWGGAVSEAKDMGFIPRNSVNSQNEYVSKYARCRIVASAWLDEAAARAVNTSAKTESEVRERIQSTFQSMDNDPQLFEMLSAKARQIWSRANCSAWLSIYRDFQKPEVNCGIFSVEGNQIEVENRKTLSESSIAGRVYKIALQNSDSTSASSENAMANDARTSIASRESDSRDRYIESKKTASLSKAKTLDKSSTTAKSRSAGNSMKAAPAK